MFKLASCCANRANTFHTLIHEIRFARHILVLNLFFSSSFMGGSPKDAEEGRMKRLLPIGAVLAPQMKGTKLGSLAVSRTDWKTGRSFEQEEHAAGMLSTMNTSPIQPARGSGPLHPLSFRRIRAVAKVIDSDWQMNEISERGDVVVLGPRPHGRYRKIAPTAKTRIESDSQDFEDPAKEYADKVVHLGVYRKVEGSLPPERPVLQFSLYRESVSDGAVLRRLHREVSIPADAVSLASGGDGFGCVSQLGRAVGVTKEQLPHASRHYSLRPIIINPLQHYPLSQATERSRGSHWRVLLRCVEAGESTVQEALQLLRRTGFVNFFPLRAFAPAVTHSAQRIASHALRGDVLSAARMVLQAEVERVPIHYEHYLRYASAEESSVRGLLDVWMSVARQYRYARRVIPVIEALQNAAAGTISEDAACKVVLGILSPPSLPDIAAMFVWNAMASQRAMSFGGAVVAGDLVRVMRSPEHTERLRAARQQIQTSQDFLLDPFPECDPSVASSFDVEHVKSGEEGRFTIEDVVLPLPGPSPALLFPKHCVSEELYRKFAAQQGLPSLLSGESSAPSNGAPRYRTFVAFPRFMEHRCILDPNSFTTIKSDLFVAQERKAIRMGLDNNRVRLPCELNMSRYSREELAPVLEAHKEGKHSVALSCYLPRGAHITSLLREVFELSMLNWSDYMTPTI